MSQGEVIRQLYTELGLTVDTASAAKAEAVMQEWAASAERLGNVVALAAGKLAEFINQTGEVASGIRRIGRALEKTGPGMAQFTVQAMGATKAMAEQAQAGSALHDGMSAVARESWLAAKKTSALGTGLKDMAEGVEAVKKAEAAQAQAERTRVSAHRASNRSTEEGIGTWAKLGLAIQGVRSVMDIAAGAAHFLVGGLVETSKETLNAAKVSGVSARFFQETAYAAQTVGIDVGDLRDVFVDLSDKASNGGKDQAAAFKKLGVDVKDAHGKLRPMEDVLLELADGFAKTKDGTEKTAMASTLLGEQGARLLPVLSKGRAGLKAYAEEARRAGVVLDEDALKSSEDFNKSMLQLQASGTGLRNTVGGALIPALDLLAKSLDKALRKLMPIIKSKAKEWATTLATATEWLTTGVDKLRTAVTLAAGVLLGKYLLALSTVTAAELTWGSAALIAGARAAAGAALALAPWLLVGGVIAIAADELYGFATGSDSALGDFIKWLDKVDPEDNGIVNMLKRAGSLVFDITDTKKWSGWWESMKGFESLDITGLSTLVRTLEKLVAFFGQLRGSKPLASPDLIDPTLDMTPQSVGDIRFGGGTLFSRLGIGTPAAVLNETEEQREAARRRYGIGGSSTAPMMSLPSGPGAAAAYFGRGASAETAVPAMSRATASPGVFSPTTTIQMTVQASPGMSAEEVGMSAVDAAYSRADAEKRQAFAVYSES